MEKSTSKTFLYYAPLTGSNSTPGTFQKLIDITSYPAIFSAPEKLDVSDLSSNQKKYTQGMVDVPDYEFGFIYTKASYDTVKNLEKDGTKYAYQLRFGANGEYGAWQWTGTHFATPKESSVGAAREGTLTCYPEGDITEATVGG